MLGPMTGFDPGDAETRDSAGLAHRDYTVFLGKRSLAGVRIGVVRDGSGGDPQVDAAFEKAVARLKSLGAQIVDPVKYPPQVLNNATRRAVVKVVCDTEKAVYFDRYLAQLAPAYPHTLADLAKRGLALHAPEGTFSPYPVVYQGLQDRVASGEGMDSLAYLSAKEHGIEMIRTGVLGVFEANQLDVIVYPTRPYRPHEIIPDEPLTGRSASVPSEGATAGVIGLTNIGNITGFPDLVAPAGLSSEGLPISISFVGPAFSEPRLLEIAYAYEQAMPPLPLPSHTPALRGESFKVR
jgi:amidase